MAFGLTAVTSLLVGGTFWLRLLGGIFLLYLGVQTMRARPAERPAEVSGRGLIGAYLSTLVLTIANPLTVLSFVGIFAGLGIGTGGYSGALLLVLGVFLGSAAWWLLLSGGVSLLRARITPAVLGWVNRCSGHSLSPQGWAP